MRCLVCGALCDGPMGNWNRGKVPLCSDPCKLKRKTMLQRERRAQKELPLFPRSAGTKRKTHPRGSSQT